MYQPCVLKAQTKGICVYISKMSCVYIQIRHTRTLRQSTSYMQIKTVSVILFCRQSRFRQNTIITNQYLQSRKLSKVASYGKLKKKKDKTRKLLRLFTVAGLNVVRHICLNIRNYALFLSEHLLLVFVSQGGKPKFSSLSFTKFPKNKMSSPSKRREMDLMKL